MFLAYPVLSADGDLAAAYSSAVLRVSALDLVAVGDLYVPSLADSCRIVRFVPSVRSVQALADLVYPRVCAGVVDATDRTATVPISKQRAYVHQSRRLRYQHLFVVQCPYRTEQQR